MKKKKIWKGIGIGVCGIVLLAAVLAIAFHRAAYAVFRNLTTPVVEIDETAVWTGGTVYENVAYATDSESQYLDLYVPDTAEGTRPKLFVLIHGGGFVSGDSQTKQAQLMYRYFRDQGYACATVNYRLAQEAAFPAGLSDCKAAIRFLRAHGEEYGYDGEQIAVFGESAGGYLAVMCAVTNDEEFNGIPFIGQEEMGDVSSQVDVLVDYYGHIDQTGAEEDWKALGIPGVVIKIANTWISGSVLQGYESVQSLWFRKNVSEMTEEELAVVDPYTYVRENDLAGLSVWIVHGDCDITVPYLHSERLAEALSEKLGDESVRYHLVPGQGHATDPLYSDQLLGELKDFLDEVMA